MIKSYYAYYKSPIGILRIEASNDNITTITFVDETIENNDVDHHLILKECLEQLGNYFAHRRKEFNLKLNPKGTDFQKKVWAEVAKIPFGQTESYSEIANRLGNKNALRAVGGANGSNPIPIIIPCHRVIGANNKLVGYGGGLWRKKWLLQHENVLLV